MTQPVGECAAIELDGLTKCYRKNWTGARTYALDRLSLRVSPGEVIGLLGPNGSGKSTTLKLLAGLIFSSSGRARIFGNKVGSQAAKMLVGYLPESPQFPSHLSGRAFLRYCAELSGLGGSDVNQRVHDLLTWSQLVVASDEKIGTYSKGMVQRLGLAQAVIHDPQVMLLDEPASGLDPQGRLTLNRLIRELAERGKTVVFSSHLLVQASELCDRIVILGQGRLLMEGTPEALLGVTRTRGANEPEPSGLEKIYLEKINTHA